MKKVAIITFTSVMNYGNRLQNYALQEVIKKMGYKVSTIPKRMSRHDKIDKYIYIIKQNVKNLLHKNKRKGIYLRNKSFWKFNKEKIKFSKYSTYCNTHSRGLNEAFDYFVCGSDQIWNPLFSDFYQDIESSFAMFADNDKRIAYAASFGIEILPDKYTEQYKKMMENMKNISVREEAGANIVKKLIGKNVEVVLDPTMLLSRDEWEDFSRKPRWDFPKEYIVTYFLGKKSEKEKEYVANISKKHNIPVIEIQHEYYEDKDISNFDVFAADPTEFVYLIAHSKMIFTDSYHCSVFSIIFNKNFRVFQRDEGRNDMSSRINTLMEIIGTSKNLGNINENIDNILYEKDDYKYDNLEKLKFLSMKFLENALE